MTIERQPFRINQEKNMPTKPTQEEAWAEYLRGNSISFEEFGRRLLLEEEPSKLSGGEVPSNLELPSDDAGIPKTEN